jgi:hypothetical protein
MTHFKAIFSFSPGTSKHVIGNTAAVIILSHNSHFSFASGSGEGEGQATGPPIPTQQSGTPYAETHEHGKRNKVVHNLDRKLLLQ